ncbi:hypothetical protein SAMN02910265_02779 [Ruminococcus flavefaciens]|uniref:Uncharacterized protein n=1 Tax=Ruminococcus flavefaciens TaxID=1265 RepID=A0A1H6L6T1_RUMFL|nr:hypothetical protein [Ruminococcus flavefaciens]SEH80201.1 hypothetical protein SAMN02910265_02779 [Ruminococcus flavefaciens]
MKENSNIIVVSIIFLLIIAALMAIGFAVYRASYTRKINKRLAEGRKAKIKPMMSPVKFVIVILTSAVGIVLVLWAGLIVFVSAKMKMSHMNMISEPSIIMMHDTLLEDSLIGEYSFGDEIKGYTKHTVNKGDTCIEIYTLDQEYTHAFAPVLATAKYTGSRSVTFSDITVDFEFNHFSANWDTMSENGLIAIDTGGYKDDFTITYSLFFGKYTDSKEQHVDVQTRVKLNVNEYSQVTLEE